MVLSVCGTDVTFMDWLIGIIGQREPEKRPWCVAWRRNSQNIIIKTMWYIYLRKLLRSCEGLFLRRNWEWWLELFHTENSRFLNWSWHFVRCVTSDLPRGERISIGLSFLLTIYSLCCLWGNMAWILWGRLPTSIVVLHQGASSYKAEPRKSLTPTCTDYLCRTPWKKIVEYMLY